MEGFVAQINNIAQLHVGDYGLFTVGLPVVAVIVAQSSVYGYKPSAQKMEIYLLRVAYRLSAVAICCAV